uniref:Colon carcinoma-associated antigen pE4 n=1 Tax=Rattus norvegicus TaxID=10116 RepID=Q7M048_RAT
MAPLAGASRSRVWSAGLLRLLLLSCFTLQKAGGEIAVQVLSNSTGFLGGSTVLHCSLASKDNVTITQLTWMKRDPDGSPFRACLPPQEGPSISDPERVKFLVAKVYEDLRNASLAISNLRVEDEGIYECQIATFPTGSKSANVWLKVFARPKNTAEALEPSPTLMPQDVAKCISADGHPPGRITWSSNVNGSYREMKETGSSRAPPQLSATSPWCLLARQMARTSPAQWNMKASRSRTSRPLILSLPYPPEVSISGYEGNWYIGLTNVNLTCEARSKPPPTNYSWSTATGPLPNSTHFQENGSHLLISTVDDLNNTIFVCKAINALGSGQGQVTILVKEASEILPPKTKLRHWLHHCHRLLCPDHRSSSRHCILEIQAWLWSAVQDLRQGERPLFSSEWRLCPKRGDEQLEVMVLG